jgi:hypothetical protein
MNTNGLSADQVLKSVTQRIDYELYFLKLLIEDMPPGPAREASRTQYNFVVCIRQWIAIDFGEREGKPEVAPKLFVWDGPPATKRMFLRDDGSIY